MRTCDPRIDAIFAHLPCLCSVCRKLSAILMLTVHLSLSALTTAPSTVAWRAGGNNSTTSSATFGAADMSSTAPGSPAQGPQGALRVALIYRMGARRLLRRRALVRDVLAAGRRSSAPFWATARDALFRPQRVAGFRSREQHGSGARACCLAAILASRASLLHALSAGVRHADNSESGVGRPFGYPLSHPRRCASQGDAVEARPQV